MAGPAAPEPNEVLSVAAVNRLAKATLEAGFPSIWVSGEISQIYRPTSGHVYLKLKDETATIDATIFKGALLRVRFDLHEGLQVLARGRLSIYEARGSFQLNIDQMLPKGIGPLELAFQQLKERLQAKGYFDLRRKRALPTFPRSIAIVTSPSGAAIRDMLEILARRWPVADVLLAPVRVQGEGAAAEIAQAIAELNELHRAGVLRVEAMIVGRGGGSLDDLWPFNEEVVADAVFASAIPVISAVGHEIDVTISDLVADHRALTPSHAITDLTPDRAELLGHLNERRERLRDGMLRRIAQWQLKVRSCAERQVFRQPLDVIRNLEQRLDEWEIRLRRSGPARVQKGREQLAALAGRLDSLSPLGVLARGYSLTQVPGGRIVRRIADAAPGEQIVTRLVDGSIVSRVEELK